MRFSAVILAGVFALVSNAQTTVAPSSPEASLQADVIKCLDACAASDVDCQSHCIAVPNPTPEQVNALNDCVAECPQGNGSAEETANYIACRDGCIGKYYYTNTGTPAPTGGSGSGNGNDNEGASATTTPTGSITQAATGTSQTTTSTPNAAPVVAGSASFGLLSFLAAFLL